VDIVRLSGSGEWDESIAAGSRRRLLTVVAPMVLLWHIFTMKTTMDPAGRIVVPKALREALNLKAGQPLEIRVGDGRIEIEVATTPMALQKRGKDIFAVPEIEMPKLTAEDVRDALERVRR
jgi:AbrB family looped-hinge helix DNA binding protein